MGQHNNLLNTCSAAGLRDGLSPAAAFECRLTEMSRTRIGDGGNDVEAVREAWKAFAATVPAMPVVNGTSLNLEQGLFVGVVGWKGAEVSFQS